MVAGAVNRMRALRKDDEWRDGLEKESWRCFHEWFSMIICGGGLTLLRRCPGAVPITSCEFWEFSSHTIQWQELELRQPKSHA